MEKNKKIYCDAAGFGHSEKADKFDFTFVINSVCV